MTDDQIIRDQAKAMRDDIGMKPAPSSETPRQARWRVEREKAQRDAKQNPHKRY